MIGTIPSVIVGVVICVAGASKIASGQRWPIDAVALGTPDVLVPIVPWFEIILGALLVAHIAPVITGMIAFVLLTVFTFLIVRQLRLGHRPVCACFGAWSSRPLGPEHVVRNVILMALALLTVVL
ncbi:MAG: MauE/DoxX family redox-associated membrane protein [Actinomycetes bacterium]